MKTEIKIRKVSFLAAATIGIMCFCIAVAANETILPDRGKAVFLILFVMSSTIYMHKQIFEDIRIAGTFFALLVAHIALIFVAPLDSTYPGAILAPVGLLDVVFCHFVLKAARNFC